MMPITTKFKALLSLSLIAGGVLYAAVAFPAAATYTYDDLDRLIRVDYDDGTSIGYDYDELGNRLRTYTNPIASFTASPLTGLFPLTVNFTDTTTGYITSRQWTFGDGTTSNEQNPSHTFNNIGSYTVTLTVGNPAGSNTATKTALITVQPCSGANHVQIAGKGSYASLQAAYNAAASGDTIQVQAQQVFSENLTANRNISVSLVGGYLCDYSSTPYTSTLQGVLTTSSGTVTVSNFVLKQ